MARHFLLTADGGSRGNPGPAGYGTVITENGKIVAELYDFIGVATNNVAEYSGLIAGLTAINEIDANLTLVDFGCSNGDFINYISQYHSKIIGIEINKKQATATANRFAANSNITIISTDMTNYSVASNHILYMYEPMWLEPDKAIDVYAKVFSKCLAKYVIYITGITKLAPVIFFELFGYKLMYESLINRMIIFNNIVYLFSYID